MKTSDILKYRSAWLGFAMLWIVWCHWGVYPTLYPIAFLKNIGYGGVDICLLASGMGCYFSLRKDPSLLGFYKRRVHRLFPTWLCFVVVWILWRYFSGLLPVSAVLGNLLGIQDWTGLGNAFNWYIGALFMFYLLSPLLKEIADSLKGIPQAVLVIAFLLLLTVPFWNAYYIISITRLPVFFVGMLLGRALAAERELSPKLFLLSATAALLGACLLLIANRRFEYYLWNYGLHWYPFILIAPGICLTMSYLLHILRNNGFGRFLSKCLSLIGKYSFEIYLVHAFVFEVLRHLISPLGILSNSPLVWLLTLPVIIAGCFGLYYATSLLQKLFTRRQKSIPLQ